MFSAPLKYSWDVEELARQTVGCDMRQTSNASWRAKLEGSSSHVSSKLLLAELEPHHRRTANSPADPIVGIGTDVWMLEGERDPVLLLDSSFGRGR